MISRRGRFDMVIKVGGSLGRGRDPSLLVRRLARLARRRRLLVVPGGGLFADLVRSEMRRFRLSEAAAHSMAIRAMDQYGLLLAGMSPRARTVEGLDQAARAARSGRLPILLASAMVGRARGLERSFRLTSDSIAAWMAGRTGAPRLVLLKSVARPKGPLGGPPDLDAIAGRGLVDPLFPATLPPGVEVWILDGRRPADLSRLEKAGGGRLRPGPAPVRRGVRRRVAPRGKC